MTIDLQYGGNDHLFPKFYTRGKASHKTTDDGSQHTDQPTKLIDEHEPTTAILRRSERARRPTKFYQLGLDYVNYMDAGEPTSYEEAIVAPDAKPWLQAMNLANGYFGTNMYPTQTNPNTKLGSSRRDSKKNTGSITTRYSHM